MRTELPGHIVNRLQAALWREAYWLVREGAASVADIDNDGSAEIVIGSNNYWMSGWSGITVFGHNGSGWMKSGPTWHTHDFAVTNINPDGSVPATPTPWWQVYNVYRARPAVDTAAMNLTPAFVADIARSGLAGVRTPEGATRLQPVGSPHRYDGDVVPGIVLADWIANRAHRGLRYPHKEPLQSLVSHGALGLREAPLPVLFAPLRGGNRLPTLGVDGSSRDLIRRAMQGGSVDVSGLDSWVRGVTEPWVRAAAEWTR